MDVALFYLQTHGRVPRKRMNQAGIDLLKHYEGFRDRAYYDMVGVPTIGYGFTTGVKIGDKMSLEEGEARLQRELAEFEKGLGIKGTANQLAACCCLAYNIGSGHFAESSVKRHHLAGEYEAAADAFRMWNRGGGRVVFGLVRRREAERTLYLTP